MSRNQALIDIILVIGVCATYVLLEAVHVPKRWSFLAMGLALAPSSPSSGQAEWCRVTPT
jgi:hypothetical protein